MAFQERSFSMVLKSIDSDPDCLGSNPSPAVYLEQVILSVSFLIRNIEVIM